MDSFSATPATAQLFPSLKETSPTALLLTSGVGVEGLAAALKGGWIDPNGLVEEVEGKPALAHWIEAGRAVLNPSTTKPVPVWPTSPEEGWEGVEPQLGSSLLRPSTNTAAREQWVLGACVAMAPHGLGLLHWEEQDRPDSNTSVLSLVVEQGWPAVVSQLLRRTDAPIVEQIQAMRTSRVRGGWSLSKEQQAPKRENRFMPLLHWSLSQGDVATARLLLEYGVSPVCEDDNGLPAWLCCEDVDTLNCVLSYVKDPGVILDPPVPAGEWWANTLGSVAAAKPLLSALDEWSHKKVPPQLRDQAVLSVLAAGLPTTALASLRSQLTSFSIRPSTSWQQQGRQWTLATASLAWAACLNPFSNGPARAWALGVGRLEKEPPVWEGVPNLDALWWLSSDWPKAEKLWASRSAGNPPNTVEGAQAWVEALVAMAQSDSAAWFGKPLTPGHRSRLLQNAWRALAKLPQEVENTPRVFALRDLVLSSALTFGERTLKYPLVVWCFDRALSQFDAGSQAEASRWAQRGLEMWLNVSPEKVFEGIDAQRWEQMIQKDPKKIRAYFIESIRVQEKIYRKLAALVAQGVSFGECRPSPEVLARWEGHEVARQVVPLLHAATLTSRLNVPSASEAPVRRPRM